MRAGRRGVWLAAGVSAALAAAGLAPAVAREEVELDSFAGSCSIQGTNQFDPPVKSTQQILTIAYDGPGTCSGVLNGRPVSNAPVQMRATGRSDGSCLRATSLEGRGAFTFADGTAIRYTFEFLYISSEGDQTWHGQRSGTAPGRGSFRTQRSAPPAEVVAKCNGEGHRELPLDLSFSTTSPLVSERLRGTAGQRRAILRDHKAPRIRLTGAPRKRCAHRGFRARVRIRERWSGLRRAQLSLDGRRLLVTRKKRFSRRIPARRLRPARHRLTVVARDSAGNRSVKEARFRSCRPRPRN